MYFPYCDLKASHVLIIIIIVQLLIQLLKFHNMSEDILENMLCVMRIVGEFRRDTENLCTLPDVQRV